MKELLVLANPSRGIVMILVPKKRGTGFLKAPFGHHQGPLSKVEAEIGFDLWGLDGSLDVQTGSFAHEDKDELLARIMPPLEAHYGMGWREVDEIDFWSLHPDKNVMDDNWLKVGAMDGDRTRD